MPTLAEFHNHNIERKKPGTGVHTVQFCSHFTENRQTETPVCREACFNLSQGEVRRQEGPGKAGKICFFTRAVVTKRVPLVIIH